MSYVDNLQDVAVIAASQSRHHGIIANIGIVAGFSIMIIAYAAFPKSVDNIVQFCLLSISLQLFKPVLLRKGLFFKNHL